MCILFLVVLVVETLLHHYAGISLLADLYLQLCAKLSILGVDESHADRLVCRYGMVTGGHLADLLTFVEHLVSVPRNGAILKLDADNSLLRTLCLLLCKSLLADKLFLVQLAEHAETSHNGSDVC